MAKLSMHLTANGLTNGISFITETEAFSILQRSLVGSSRPTGFNSTQYVSQRRSLGQLDDGKYFSSLKEWLVYEYETRRMYSHTSKCSTIAPGSMKDWIASALWTLKGAFTRIQEERNWTSVWTSSVYPTLSGPLFWITLHKGEEYGGIRNA